jgi:endonuclease/exonuclease/phosphatase family metal-dependent hydrolase
MRLVSWNIQWGRGLDGRVDLVRCVSSLRAYDPDVICLQEVAVNHPGLPGGAAMDQVSVLSGLFLGYEHAYGAATDLPDGLGGRRLFGNMILSRYPLLQVFRHALPFGDATPFAPKPAMARAALEAVVAAPWGAVRVITTHLEFYSSNAREKQLAALGEIYRSGWKRSQLANAVTDTDPPFAVLPAGEQAVICGDFNCAPDAPEMAALLRADSPSAVSPAPTLLDAWPAMNGLLPHLPTAGKVASEYFPHPVCFDRAYLSENLLPQLRGVDIDIYGDASDHQALILDFHDTCTA